MTPVSTTGEMHTGELTVECRAVVIVRAVFDAKLSDLDGFVGGFSAGSGGGGATAWNMSSLEAALSGGTTDSDSAAGKKKEKATTAEEFLGSNANLVNLNELIVRPPPSSKSSTS